MRSKLNIKDEPFWLAFDKFADSANITIYPYVGEPRKLAIVTRPEEAKPRFGAADYRGLFRIEVTSVQCQASLRDPRGDRMQLGLEVLWEPKVIPILFRQNLEDVVITTRQRRGLELETDWCISNSNTGWCRIT